PVSSGSGANAIVAYAQAIANGDAEPGWGGGYVPYSWGGGHAATPGPSLGTCVGYTGPSPCEANQTKGVDCSGFTRWVYDLAYGFDVLGAGNTNNQIAELTRVSSPAPGDLVFYGTSTANTHHVGVYIGNGEMIDALQTGTVVREDSVSLESDIVGYYRETAHSLPTAARG
ncbi:C40 family peptidase, partial [Rugosimonospora africana]|uniref:C40 family peptidase n=1 Tax=Rugosimonospora africana TaxID=556532 RepID=UPI00194308D4